MRIRTRNLRQYAVLWEASGLNEYGESKIKKPVEIKCRWEEGKKQSLDAQGNVIEYDGRIYLPCEVPEGSVLWKGRLMDKPNDSVITNLREVVSTGDIPNIKATERQVFANVKNYKNKLPDFA